MASSGKSLLKVHVFQAEGILPPKKKNFLRISKIFEPHAHVVVHDENGNSIGKDGEFKTNPLACRAGSVLWNQSCMFALHRKPNYKIIIKLMDQEDEITTIEVPLETITGTAAESVPKWYTITETSRVQVSMGWYGVGGALQGQIVKGRQSRLTRTLAASPIPRKSVTEKSGAALAKAVAEMTANPQEHDTTTATTTATTTTTTTTPTTTPTTTTTTTTVTTTTTTDTSATTPTESTPSLPSTPTTTAATATTPATPGSPTQTTVTVGAPTSVRASNFIPRASKRAMRGAVKPGEAVEDVDFMSALKKTAEELTAKVQVVYQLERDIQENEFLMQQMRDNHDQEVEGVRQRLEGEMEQILSEKDMTVEKLIQEKEPILLELDKKREDHAKNVQQERTDMDEEIERIKKEMIQLREALNTKEDRTERYEAAVRKFAEFDDDARELVGMEQSLTSRTAQEEVKKQKEAKVPVKHSQIANSPNGYSHYLIADENLDLLANVRQKLLDENGAWVKKFFFAGALDNIVAGISKIENNRKADIQMQMKEAQLASLLRAAMSKYSVLQYLIQEQKDTLKNLVETILFSRNNLMKAQHLILLAALAVHSKNAHKFVDFAVKITSRNPRPYFSIVKLLKEEKDTSLIIACMTLVNALIVGEKDIGNRIKIRLLLIDAELAAAVEKLREKFSQEKSLIMQFDTFDNVQAKDQEELKELKFVGNTDLQHPGLLFDKVIQQCQSSNTTELLLSLLHHLLLFPEVTEKPKDFMLFIERALRRMLFPYAALGEIKIKELHDTLLKFYGGDSLLTAPAAPVAAPPPAASAAAPVPVQAEVPLSEHQEEEARRKAEEEILLDETVPPPRRTMRHLYWKKIPNKKLPQYWNKVNPDLARLEPIFPLLEEFFYESGAALQPTKKKPELKPKIEILPVQNANYINILRTRFSGISDDEILQGIIDIEEKNFSADQLLALQNCVPTEDMAETLRKYDGDMAELRDAEKFALRLLKVTDNVGDKLKSLYFRAIYNGYVEVTKDHFLAMRAACEEVLNDAQLQGLLGVILAANNYLNYNNKGIDSNIIAKINQAKALKKVNYSLNDFITEFIFDHFAELSEVSLVLARIEDASQFQPQIAISQLKEMRGGLENIAKELDGTPQEKKEGNGAKYYDVMEKFMEVAATQLQELEEEIESLKALATDVLKAFNHPAHSPLENLFKLLHSFSEKWQEISTQFQQEQEQLDYFVDMGWVHYDETGLLVIEDGEEQKQVPQGILDQLIASVMRGDYGVDTDEDTKRRRHRIVPVKPPPPVPEPKPQTVAEAPVEPPPPKKTRKVFKIPTPLSPEQEEAEFEAKLAARVMKEVEAEAEEEARRAIAAESRKKTEAARKAEAAKAEAAKAEAAKAEAAKAEAAKAQASTESTTTTTETTDSVAPTPVASTEVTSTPVTSTEVTPTQASTQDTPTDATPAQAHGASDIGALLAEVGGDPQSETTTTSTAATTTTTTTTTTTDTVAPQPTPKKLVIPTTFTAPQQEAEEQKPKKNIAEEIKQQRRQQHQQLQQGDTVNRPQTEGEGAGMSIAAVEALLESDDFDALEKLYDDFYQ